MVEEIRKTLTEVKEGIEQRTIPLEKFEILKKLTHRPEDYRDAKSQPHVLVALRLNQTKYVYCFFSLFQLNSCKTNIELLNNTWI